MGASEVEAFLTHLAVAGQVSASTQNQALAAILFLYKDVLSVELPWLDGVTRAKKFPRIPVVLTESEVRVLLAQLDGTHHLIASLLYGSGLRLMEAMRLRVKDVDFERREITVRDGQGGARTGAPCCRGRLWNRWVVNSTRCAPSMSKISRIASLQSIFRMPVGNWVGSTSFPPWPCLAIRVVGSCVVIT